jgi:hypothetical protein
MGEISVLEVTNVFDVEDVGVCVDCLVGLATEVRSSSRDVVEGFYPLDSDNQEKDSE